MGVPLKKMMDRFAALEKAALEKIAEDPTGTENSAELTGVPGAGKTLVGLDVAVKQTYQGSDKPVENEGAVYLSGNGPLVAVLN